MFVSSDTREYHNPTVAFYDRDSLLKAVRSDRALQLSQQSAQEPLHSLRLRLRIDILDPNRPVRRLDLDLIALPLVISQQAKIADKVPPRGAELTELGRVLGECLAKGDATVVRRER
jgi:hypothetical protein